MGAQTPIWGRKGGTGYWSQARVVDATYYERDNQRYIDTYRVVRLYSPFGDFDPIVVRADALESAAKRLADSGMVNQVITDRIKSMLKIRCSGQIDAGDADCIVQYAAFGEVIYG